MQVIRNEFILNNVPSNLVPALDKDLAVVVQAARNVVWPANSKGFTINPTPGANGTPEIKKGFVAELMQAGWKPEKPIFAGRYPPNSGPGPVDVATDHGDPRTIVEWETGNVSSSHRALNKMVLAFKYNLASQGIWVVPTRKFYKYLTGRTGSYEEVAPYFPVYDRKDVVGRIAVLAIEYDQLSSSVDVIKKMAYKGNLSPAIKAQLDALPLEDSEPS